MQRRQTTLLFYLCAAIGALVLLAASLAQLSFRPGRAFIIGGDLAAEAPGGAEPATLGDLGYWRVLVTAIVLALLAYFVVRLIFSARLRWLLLRRLAGALAAVLLFYLLANWLGDTLPKLTTSSATNDTPAPAETAIGEPLPAFVAQPSAWLVVLVSLVLVALVIAGMWFFWRRSQPAAHPVTALAQEAIENIQAGGDLQSIVLRCYLEMSEVLGEQSGITRQRAMTPREFERQLAGAGVRDEHIKQLTRLFEQARYSAQAPSERDERAAVECLTAIVRAYGGAA
jgi:hypothetical protein